MTNVQASVKGHILTLQIDLSQNNGKSSSGKTTIVGTSSGNQPVEGHPGIFVGLNVFKKA